MSISLGSSTITDLRLGTSQVSAAYLGTSLVYQTASAAPVSGIQRLAISSSLYAYYDVAFTASYSGSGQTGITDLSPNGKNGTVNGTLNFDTTTISGSVLRLGSSTNANNIAMPTITLGSNFTFVVAWYMTSGTYAFDAVEVFAGRDTEAYGMLGLDDTYNGCMLPIVEDTYGATLTPTPTNSAQSGSWHISQFSFDDTTNNVNYCMDGATGSYQVVTSVSTGTITPKFNLDSGARTLNSGSMMQVMALYTGSLSTAELLQNHNSLKARYGLA